MALLAPPPPRAEPFQFSHPKNFLPDSSLVSKNCRVSMIFGASGRIGKQMKTLMPIVRASSSPSPSMGNEADSSFCRKIMLSDVIVQRRRNVYWGRTWSCLDIATVGVVLAMHCLCIFAPFTFNWGAVSVSFGLYVITGLLGITLSFHRNLSHRSFKLPKWLEYLFAYCGVQALQGNPIDWVSTHRYHHQFCDTEKDPHSPIEGFWLSHMSWLFDTETVVQRCGEPNNVGDLEKQPFYKFLQSTYVIPPCVTRCTALCNGRISIHYLGNGGENCVGVPHNMASEFCVSFMGKLSMEHG